MSRSEKVEIILPTLNEASNLLKLLPMLKAYSVTVVDDGSKDLTVPIAQKHGANVIDRKNAETKGLTASVIAGIRQSDAESIIVMDADLQHPPAVIPEIIMLLSKYDLIICRRRKVISKWSVNRKIMSKLAIVLGSIRLLVRGRYYHDIMSGFFGGNTNFLKETIEKNEHKFEMKGYKVLFDILKYMPDINVGYISYDFGSRNHGASQLSARHYVCFLRSLFK